MPSPARADSQICADSQVRDDTQVCADSEEQSQPDDHPLTAALAARNAALAEAGVSLRIERRGQRLGLRGPLPGKGGEGGLRVRRISLGLNADPAGLEEATQRLREVLRELQAQRFEWTPRRQRSEAAVSAPQPAHSDATGSLQAQLAEFERAFFQEPKRRRNPAGSRTTWTAAYRPYLRRLATTDATTDATTLDPALLERTLESYPLGSRSRQQCGTALAALARHLKLTLPDDWSQRAGGYGLHAARFRRLPSDQQILQQLERIPNRGWRLAYGLMATYGLRNHEVFFCDLSALAPGGDRVIRVLPTSKTGEHQVWPFQPGWVERFDLEELGCNPALLPPVRTDLRHTTLQQAGRRVAEQFRRYGLELTPYDLRHAWAVRTIHIGLPDTVAARMMGHSVSIHTRTYHHWITRRDQQQAVDAALERLQSGRSAA
jgi:hypothetical protein